MGGSASSTSSIIFSQIVCLIKLAESNERVKNVTPRPYQLGARQVQINDSRQKVIDAARALLTELTSYTSFTVDAVAKRADVARATIYYQFESKIGLLDAICDALAEDGQMSDLASAFMNPDPIEALSIFIACFARFWNTDRPVMRRLRSLARLEQEVGGVISARDERRNSGLVILVARLSDQHLLNVEPDRAVQMLFTLTSFETFDSLAADNLSMTEVEGEILAMTATIWKDPKKTPLTGSL
jgi:AcrR family transcriptional regulator